MDWIKIENLNRFLLQFKPELIHPDDPRWIPFWRDMKKKCIEGVWFEDFGKWRYGRGNLGFEHWYCRLPDVDKKQKIHGKMIKPLIRDLEWHYSYYMLEARGFSGFSEDEEFTSDYGIFNIDRSKFAISDPDYLKYFKPNGEFKEFVSPRENLFRLHDKPVGVPLYGNDAKNVVILGSRGGSKAARHGSKVHVTTGTKNIEDIQVGDYVYGADGKLAEVKGVYPQGKVPLYKVTFRSGRTVDCCKDHLWEVYPWDVKHPQVKRTEDLLLDFVRPRKKTDRNPNGKEYKYKVKNNKCVEYPHADLPIDPYLIGCLLGDGHVKLHGKQRIIELSSGMKDCQHYIDNIVLPEHYKIRLVDNTKYNRCPKLIISTTKEIGRKQIEEGNHLFERLEKLGVACYSYEKSIDESYLIADRTQRLRLLQGLMDTDGYISKKGKNRTEINFSSSSQQLIKDVVRLARSLGIAVHEPRFYENEHKGYYIITLYTNLREVFSLPRKVNSIIPRTGGVATSRMLYDYIIDISPIDEDYATCITVDNEDHCFLIEDYVVTHNTLYSALGELKHDICFDGAKYYNDETRLNPTAIKINVGAGLKNKSAKLLDEIKASMDNLALDPECGTWGKPGDEDYEPCPFYKHMTGSFKTDDTRGWTNKFKVKSGTDWVTKGTGSTVYHMSYSANKKTGAEAGAGGRRSLIIYEEIGLFEDLLNAWGSDEAVVSIDGVQFAPRIGIGTSGNIETIASAKHIFTHPKEYNCLEFPNEDGDGVQAFFLPAYIVDKRFKDENGNTDVVAAKRYYEDQLEEKLKTNDSAIINNYKMNYPTKVDHMWVSKSGDLLPVKEAELREKELLRNNLFESIGTPIRLYYDPTQPTGVNYEVDLSLNPFYDDNFADRTDLSGCVVMYEQPFTISGVIPTDAHIITHDPYVSDAWEEGGSLGATHVWINPKYIPQGAKGNCLAATYIGKHIKGVDGYNEVLEKLCAFYGNPFRQLWYESNRGDRLRSYFIRKNKAHLMCLQPQFEQGSHIYLRNTNKTGFVVGSQVAKISMIDRLNEWLLEETQLNGEDEPKLNIFRIPCIFTLRQIKAYKIDGNFDLVSSMLGLPLALGEIQHYLLEAKNPAKHPLKSLTKLLKQRIS